MTLGLSMALHKHRIVDPRFGHRHQPGLAGYHIAANADVGANVIRLMAHVRPRTVQAPTPRAKDG